LEVAHSRPKDSIPRPRIETLSDLIFGLALSIGAIELLSDKPASLAGLVSSLIAFGWSFTILALVWVRYTRIMSALPIDTAKILAANILLLFLVAIEPYLYNLIPISLANVSGQLDSEITTALYSIDMGSIFAVLAYFTQQLAIEERKLIPKELLRSYRMQRNTVIITSAVFLISALPMFWALSILGFPIRFLLWMGTFLAWPVRRTLDRKNRM
jgi:uncharacterized membrane protein